MQGAGGQHPRWRGKRSAEGEMGSSGVESKAHPGAGGNSLRAQEAGPSPTFI